MKKLISILAVLVVVYACLIVALFAIMHRSPGNFARTMKHVPWPAFVVLPFRPLWNVARRGAIQVGALAPDFNLESPDHKSRFQLSSARGQEPVVLVFGSYT